MAQRPLTGKLIARGFGLFQINGMHTYTAKGRHDITISVVDEDGSSVVIGSKAFVF